MTPTIDILGIEIPRAGGAFYFILAVHVPAGLVATATGAIAALSRKGGPVHVRAGALYWGSICVAFATAALLTAIRWKEDYLLLLIGTIAFLAACFGHLSRDRHRPGHAPHVLGMSVSYIAMLVAFYIDNGPQLPIWRRLPHVAYWLLPILIGGPITLVALRRARRIASSTVDLRGSRGALGE